MSTSIIEPGARLAGRYRLEDRVREAGGSTLWRAIDEILARAVAVRTFDPEFPRIASVVTAARAASRLTDPRLTQVFDADDSGEQAYVVSEWVTGETLEEMITTHGPLDPGRAATLLCEATEALAAAHHAGLAHLRLTLRDLLWTTGGTVKLLGVAVDAELAGITADDPALVDVRGLGHMLYAALTGHWPGESPSALPGPPMTGAQICAPRQIKAGIPYALDSLVCRVLDLQTGQTGAGQPAITAPAELAQALTGVPRTPLPLFAGLNPGPPPSVIPRQPSAGPPTGSAAGPATPPSRSRGMRSSAGNQAGAAHGRAGLDPPGRSTQSRPPQSHPAPHQPGHHQLGHHQPAHGPGQGRPGGGRGGPGPGSGGPGLPGRAGAPHPAPASGPAHQAQSATAFNAMGGSTATTRQPTPRSHRHGAAGGTGKPVNRPLVAVAAAVATVVVGIGAWQLTKSDDKGGPPSTRQSAGPTRSAQPSIAELKVADADGFDATPARNPDPKAASTGPLAVDSSRSTAWETQSYNTPQYGKLKSGLGVILDMGRPVTVSEVKVTMPAGVGGSLELRVGDANDFGALDRVAGRQSGLSGTFELSPEKATTGRYVLLWVTELPSSAGRLKAKISNVAVYGPEG